MSIAYNGTDTDENIVECCFVLLLYVPGNSYGHGRTVFLIDDGREDSNTS